MKNLGERNSNLGERGKKISQKNWPIAFNPEISSTSKQFSKFPQKAL